jgi:hypothetical protein
MNTEKLAKALTQWSVARWKRATRELPRDKTRAFADSLVAHTSDLRRARTAALHKPEQFRMYDEALLRIDHIVLTAVDHCANEMNGPQQIA